MTKKIIILIDTLRHLKPIQIYYRAYFLCFKRAIVKIHQRRWTKYHPTTRSLELTPSISAKDQTDGRTFVFLNLSKKFDGKIDWNFSKHGKLWTYKLNYFNFLHAPTPDRATNASLIDNYCEQFSCITTGLDPYPISLRSINWIKYLAKENKKRLKWDKILYAQMRILLRLPEYHLLGNHLLENGFALLFGAYYFRDESFYQKARKIIGHELAEQILNDGGHFERSPMYHCIILERLLDCINLTQNNLWKQDALKNILSEKAALMLGWLNQITLGNGNLPSVNDTVINESANPEDLVRYAKTLGITSINLPLATSGYRRIKKNSLYEVFIDVGDIGPDYIPGHAHSDTFNFILVSKGKTIFDETGTSTYQPGSRRSAERSTRSHNTVCIKGKEQSEVWGTFRVGRRAKIIKLVEYGDTITAAHNGYWFMGLTHERSWACEDNSVTILDELSGNIQDVQAEAFLHFHPELVVTMEDNLVTAGPATISFEGHQSLNLDHYSYANGFNKTLPAKMLTIRFTARLKTIINLTCDA